MWTLLYNGVEKSLADWGIANVRRTLLSGASDQVIFETPGLAFDGDLLFAAKSTLIIKKDGVQWFYGRVMKTPRFGSGTDEGISYLIEGPWTWLEHIWYQQYWQIHSNIFDGNSPLVSVLKTKVLMPLNAAGLKQTTGAQIRDVVNFAIAAGAPIALSEVDLPALDIPLIETRELTCAASIAELLRWSPDALIWWDYTTEPFPTLHIKRRAHLEAVSVEVGVDNIQGIEVNARDDMQVPSVLIKYERTNDVNGVLLPELITDTYPVGSTGLEFNSIVATVNLEGSSYSYLIAAIETELIDIESADWWKRKVSILDRPNVINLKVENATRESSLKRELIDGSVAPWMGGVVEQDTIKAELSFDITDDNGVVLEKHVTKPFALGDVRVTNLVSDQYRTTSIAAIGEATPIGLAAALYAATSVLQYDGRLTLVEEEVRSLFHPGQLLNVLGSRAEWSTMAATIQGVTENIDNGTTEIVFGPASHLGKDEIMELLRVNRFRFRFTPAGALTSGGLLSSGASRLGDYTPKRDTSIGQGKVDKLTIGGLIRIDKDDMAAKEAWFQEVPVMQFINGACRTRKARVLMTDLYD